MQTKQITSEDILSIPLFQMLFSDDEYAEYQDTFTNDINQGSRIEDHEALILLLKGCFNHSGINFCRQSAFYFYVFASIIRNSSYLDDAEKEYMYLCHYYEYKKTFYYKDETLANPGRLFHINFEFVCFCFELLNTIKLLDNIRSVFSYGIYIYVKEIQPYIETKAIGSVKPIFHVRDIFHKSTLIEAQITYDDVLNIHVFKHVYTKNEYAFNLDDFVYNINKGTEIDIDVALIILTAECFNASYLNVPKKATYYFFLTLLVIKNYNFENDEEKGNMIFRLFEEYKKNALKPDKAYDELGLSYFSNKHFLEHCLALFDNPELEFRTKCVLSYALYFYASKIYTIISQKLLSSAINPN
ncbi:MAG: hypothetical protein ACOYO1_00805 [Bacteroidales bacterium]